MCGLFGYVQKNDNDTKLKHLNAVIGESLGVAMQSRGTHSTGIAEIVDAENVKIQKETLPSYEFFQHERIKKQTNLLIGHTRFATVGGIHRRNAHPFRFNDIVGAHNGSVNNYLDFGGKFEVDSQVIFHLLNKKDNDYVKVFGELRGQIACSWTDLKNLYLLRHNNPLYVLLTAHTLYWCSEEIPLEMMKQFVGIQDAEITALEEDYVYRITPKLQMDSQKVEFKQSGITAWGGRRNQNLVINNKKSGKYGFDTTRGTADDDIDKYAYGSGKCQHISEAFELDEFMARELAESEGCIMCNRKIKVGTIHVYGQQVYCADCSKSCELTNITIYPAKQSTYAR